MQVQTLEAIYNGNFKAEECFRQLELATQDHCLWVARATVRLLELAQQQHLYEEDPLMLPLGQLEKAVAYHDIGILLIPTRVLNKAEELTAAERRVIQRHTGYGGKMLDRYRQNHAQSPLENEFWRLAAEVATSHHERWDGKGYPFGTVATATPLVARAVAITSSYHAIIRGGEYCMPLPHEYAIVEIMDNIGTQFDPLLAELFLNHIAEIMNCAEKAAHKIEIA